MLSPTRRPPSRRSASHRFLNDENASPFPLYANVSASMQQSEPPSSPLISNSFLYNLPDPTVGLPASSRLADNAFLPSPFKRSAIVPLNKPLSLQQSQQLRASKADAAQRSRPPPSSSSPTSIAPAKSASASGGAQANLNAPGGLPTPPSSSEAMVSTPGPSKRALAALPREPVSPSPTRSRTAAASPARTPASRTARAPSTPLRSQRGTPHRRRLTSGNQDGSDEEDLSDGMNGQTPKRTRALPEVVEESDDEEEQEDEDEIQLISFQRGGPDATFVREIKQNGWDQPLPPSPIKFTYLEPAKPRPPRSSVAARARSQSRSRTPQVRASSVLADQSADRSDESIKSSGSILSDISRLSTSTAARRARGSRRKSIAPSPAPPSVPVTDLTRDHPSLPDSPGDDPLLLTGPNTYIVYHQQTPSAKQRPSQHHSTTSDPSDTSVHYSNEGYPHDYDDQSMALPTLASVNRGDSPASVASSSSRSLYSRMSGRQPAVPIHSVDEDELATQASTDEVMVELGDADDQDQPVLAPFDHTAFGFDSDSDQDDEAQVDAHASLVEVHVPDEVEHQPDGSTISDISRSFANHSLATEHADLTRTSDAHDEAERASVCRDADESLVDVSLPVLVAAEASLDQTASEAEPSVGDVSMAANADCNGLRYPFVLIPVVARGDVSVDTSLDSAVAEESLQHAGASKHVDERDVSMAAPESETASHADISLEARQDEAADSSADQGESSALRRDESSELSSLSSLRASEHDDVDQGDQSALEPAESSDLSSLSSLDASEHPEADEGEESVLQQAEPFEPSNLSFPNASEHQEADQGEDSVVQRADSSELSSLSSLNACEQNEQGDQGDESVLQRAESVLSELSTLSVLEAPEHDEQDDEAIRRKYHAARASAPERSVAHVRRLSLSTDSESGSDAAADMSDDEHDDADAVEEAVEADDSVRTRASRDVDSGQDELESEQDDEDVQSDSPGSVVSDEDAASLGEGSDEDEDADEEEEHVSGEEEQEMDQDDEDGDEDASSTHSRHEDESESLEPVVILSSSASPSVSASPIMTRGGRSTARSPLTQEAHEPGSESDEVESGLEDDSYVISVVRDSRDRTRRTSEHSLVEDEPQIHTLHLRQPMADASGATTMADASHSRSRVLKLGQPTSTPIVEISSLDPRAAARATAILKLFHKYVDEGWISPSDLGDASGAGSATGERMRRVVEAIRRADRHGTRLQDTSALQSRIESMDGTTVAAADLTTLLMDAELALAREGSADTESLLGSRAASIPASQQHNASPATPFLPGGFRATPTAGTRVDEAASPSLVEARIRANDSTMAGNSVSFPGLSTPDHRRRSAARQARLSTALQAPALESLDARVWQTTDWVRLDKYFALGVQKLSTRLLPAAGADKTLRARAYVDALFDIDLDEVAALFLDEMRIPLDKQCGEWARSKLAHRLEALQRKYARKLEKRYPEALRLHPLARGQGDEADSLRTEDLDWSVDETPAMHRTEAGANVAQPGAKGKGRVSFGTPYRMGAHSTPAVGLLKKATSRAARDAMAGGREPLYPSLPDQAPRVPTDEGENGGVMTRASRLISRLSGGLGGMLASPRGQSDKGKRKATEAELEREAQRRRVERESDEADQSASTQASTSSADSIVESLLASSLAPRGLRSTINASMLTNATSVRPDLSDAGKRTAAPIRTNHAQTQVLPGPGASRRTAGGMGLTSSRQLVGGSSAVSHTPLSLLSPATHRVAAQKVDELRQSRAQRNWTSPRKQRALVSRLPRPAHDAGAGADVSTSSSGRDGSLDQGSRSVRR